MIERNWKHQCLPPCLARLARKSSMVRPAARLISRLNLCVFWKLVNLQGCVWESTKISWGPYCRKRWQITAALQFGLQFFSNGATMKIHAAKAAVIKRNVTNWKRFWRGTWRKSEEIRGDQWSKGQGHQSSFCLTDGHLSFEECWIGDKAPIIQRSSCSSRRYGEIWLCGFYAVFTEQGSLASPMTAANVMDIISRLPGCTGHASDAVSAYTQVKMEDAHKLWKFPNRMCPDILDSSTTIQMAKIMVQYGRCSRSSWKESVWSSFGRTFMEKAIWEDPFEAWLGENSKLSLCTSWKRIILICVCGSHQIGWKEQHIVPMWKVLNKEVDLEEPTSLLDHQDLGCTQRQCQISKDIVGNYRTIFKSWISARRTEKLSSPQNLDGLYVMEGHVKKCVERYCEFANQTTQQLYKLSIPCCDDHHFQTRIEIRGTAANFAQEPFLVRTCTVLSRLRVLLILSLSKCLQPIL